MSILVSGNLAYDYIMDYRGRFREQIMPENVHILNVAFPVDSLRRGWGGTGGNIAYNIKLLGGQPVLVSSLGSDGDEYFARLQKLGIGTDHVRRDGEVLTASCYITTDLDDNQIIAYHKGPNSLINSALGEITPLPALALISPSAAAVMRAQLKQCRAAGIAPVFDPGQEITSFGAAELREAIEGTAFVFGNDYEIRLLETRTGWSKEEILCRTRVLVTTLGKRGCLIETAAGERIEVAACPSLAVKDPTGAGDAFRAGFFVGYERGCTLETCARLGSTAASYAIEAVGTQEHCFTLEEFEKRYEAGYGERISLK